MYVCTCMLCIYIYVEICSMHRLGVRVCTHAPMNTCIRTPSTSNSLPCSLAMGGMHSDELSKK